MASTPTTTATTHGGIGPDPFKERPLSGGGPLGFPGSAGATPLSGTTPTTGPAPKRTPLFGGGGIGGGPLGGPLQANNYVNVHGAPGMFTTPTPPQQQSHQAGQQMGG